MSLSCTIEELNSVQKRVHVGVSASLVNEAFEEVYRNVQKKAKLQGFRPGKAPLSIIKKFYKESILGDVADKLINKHLFAALQDKNIRPIAAPVVEKVESLNSDQEFKFSAIVDIMPAIKIDGYKGLKLSADTVQVSEDQITKEIDFLRRRQAKTMSLPEDKAASSGHLATIGHKVFHEGQLIENMDVEEFPVALGFNEIFKDLEDAILGMKVGEIKKASIKLPDSYNDAALKGKVVDFEINLKSLSELSLPSLDDEFAKDAGFDSLDKLQSSIRDQLDKHSKSRRKQQLETQILNELRTTNSFDVPPSMVDQVIDSMIQDLKVGDEKEKKKLLKNEDLRRSFRDTAKTKAQNTLILWHVAQNEKLEVTDEKIKGFVQDQYSQITETWDEAKWSEIVKSMRPRLQESLTFDMALDFIIDSANISQVNL